MSALISNRYGERLQERVSDVSGHYRLSLGPLFPQPGLIIGEVHVDKVALIPSPSPHHVPRSPAALAARFLKASPSPRPPHVVSSRSPSGMMDSRILDPPHAQFGGSLGGMVGFPYHLSHHHVYELTGHQLQSASAVPFSIDGLLNGSCTASVGNSNPLLSSGCGMNGDNQHYKLSGEPRRTTTSHADANKQTKKNANKKLTDTMLEGKDGGREGGKYKRNR